VKPDAAGVLTDQLAVLDQPGHTADHLVILLVSGRAVDHDCLPNVDTESLRDPEEVIINREDRRPVVAGETVLTGRVAR